MREGGREEGQARGGENRKLGCTDKEARKIAAKKSEKNRKRKFTKES